MKSITEYAFRDRFAAVMDAVADGESFRITRGGVEVAELRPLRRREQPSAEELVARHRRLPRVDGFLLRSEADEFFGRENRVGPDS
ncbi:type II toxin-antitoxin system Phd/YefM family antitoxin [Streptomyces cyaneofuscatus]|uniref:type II toxin-antitoxin system Phd/YefM family antitoxin n=1 Tax=Streptomyces cyaneofuscatus TaxID=66883 RepID=UPI0037B64ACD